MLLMRGRVGNEEALLLMRGHLSMRGRGGGLKRGDRVGDEGALLVMMGRVDNEGALLVMRGRVGDEGALLVMRGPCW